MGAIRWIIVTVVAFLLLAFGGGYWLWENQGPSPSFWKEYETAEVRFQNDGIPTIKASDWLRAIEAQGYVEASQRLWQMDLIRRKAGGRLAAWFGPRAFSHDKRIRREGRRAAAERAARDLPKSERKFCEAYARGVNRFIADHPYRWGVEYLVMRTEPEPWRCRDSLLVVMEMADFLSTNAEQEARQAVWRAGLPASWERFLFAESHPWNTPYFGKKESPGAIFPPESEHLPSTSRKALDVESTGYTEEHSQGSNNWAYSGRHGHFLANDPHMGYSVPQVWFAQRLKVSRSDWVVGTSLPGVPGIVLGMNPHVAWVFTDNGEDVDDFLKETLSDDQERYLARRENGKDVWKPVETKTVDIQVKGEAEPRTIKARYTHRGPLLKRSVPEPGWYSRQWIALKPGMLRLPAVSMMRARSLEEFDQVAQRLRVPAQNILVMDRRGRMGLRVSGIGVQRRVSGLTPQPALKGEWNGYGSPADRPTLWREGWREGEKPRFLATANERIWVSEHGEYWFGADRKNRIEQVLSADKHLTAQDMIDLQLDTQGRFRALLMEWLAEHMPKEGKLTPERRRAYRSWDGSSRSNPQVFADSSIAERALTRILLARVKRAFFGVDAKLPHYRWPRRRAWLLAVLTREDGLRPFGLEAREVAVHVYGGIEQLRQRRGPHPKTNRWRTQHPFVGEMPVVGEWFRIKEHKQWGASDLVRAEQSDYGPSTRLVWNLKNPSESQWMFPVGQSGHVGSAHYDDLHGPWAQGAMRPVFQDPEAWGFEPAD